MVGVGGTAVAVAGKYSGRGSLLVAAQAGSVNAISPRSIVEAARFM
jgi:hypothetical protein